MGIKKYSLIQINKYNYSCVYAYYFLLFLIDYEQKFVTYFLS